jgi:hypothetical protein
MKHVSTRAGSALRVIAVLLLTQYVAPAFARVDAAQTRPRLNLFPTAVVESLSETSQTAKAMESDMYAVVDKLDQQKQVYDTTGCDGSSDKGCLQLRSAIRGSYKEMLDVMNQRIPQMRTTLEVTADSMGGSLRGEIGRKMTPGDVQRALAGRATKGQLMAGGGQAKARQGKLSQMFSRYYDLVRRGGSQGDALPVLASQIYLDSMQSLYFLELIEAEIGSQSTELVLELEWGELTGQISSTVNDVKTLLWGDYDAAGEILDVGLETASSQDNFADLLLD